MLPEESWAVNRGPAATFQGPITVTSANPIAEGCCKSAHQSCWQWAVGYVAGSLAQTVTSHWGYRDTLKYATLVIPLHNANAAN